MRRWASDDQRKAVMAKLGERGGVVSIPGPETGRFEHWYQPPKVGIAGRLKARVLRRQPEDPDWLVKAEREEKEEKERAEQAEAEQSTG